MGDTAAYLRCTMLPDYPDFKNELGELLNRFFRRQLAHHMGFLGTVGKLRAFEGNEMAIERATGDSETNEYAQCSVSRTMVLDEVPNLTLSEVLTQVDQVAAEMAELESKAAFKKLDDSLEAAGQTMSTKGQPLSGEVLLRMLERIELAFDSEGKINLTFVTHPNNISASEAAFRAIAEDPKLSAKYEALIQRKKEAWRAREASRRLAG